MEEEKKKILNALVELHKALPLTTDEFREKFEQLTGCEFEFDEFTEAKKTIIATDDVTILRFDKTIDVAYCGDKSYIINVENYIEVRRETFVNKGAIQEFWIANFDVKNIVKEE